MEGAAFVAAGGGRGVTEVEGGAESRFTAQLPQKESLCQDVAAWEFQRAEQRFYTPVAAAAVRCSVGGLLRFLPV